MGQYSRLLTVIAGIALGLSQSAVAETSDWAKRSHFVYAEDGQLMLDDQPYHFSATNSWQMLQDQNVVEHTLASAKSIGLNSLRFWAFINSQAGGWRDGALVYNEAPGQWPARLSYPEAAWQKLDYIVKRAGQEHIKLIMTLGNYWDGSGIDFLVDWTAEAPGKDVKFRGEAFFRSQHGREIYRQMVEHMVNRVNSQTGIAYKNDPTILMWEPLNEARGRSDASGKTIADWLNFAGQTIKSYDPNHLVGSGTEGFMAGYVNQPGTGIDGFDYSQYAFQANVYHHVRQVDAVTGRQWDDTTIPEGVYFADECAQPGIDVCSIHAWPDQWAIADRSRPDLFMRAWVQAHRDVMTQQGINKPIYLGEFGKTAIRAWKDPLKTRDWVYDATYDQALKADYAGVGFWLAGFGWPEASNQTTLEVHCDPWAKYEDSTCGVIRNYSEKLIHKGR